MKRIKGFSRSLLATAVAVAVPGTAMAQLEEVLVTATKRVESTQDIPMSVQAVSGESLNALSIDNLGDLLRITITEWVTSAVRNASTTSGARSVDRSTPLISQPISPLSRQVSM